VCPTQTVATHPFTYFWRNVAVKIRLKRMGKIRAPYYRIVVADSRTKRDGRAIEEIGKYHPTEEPSVIEVNSESAQYWLGVGAQPLLSLRLRHLPLMQLPRPPLLTQPRPRRPDHHAR
jgi:ribosomal protein S16